MSRREALRELSVAQGGFVGEQQGGSSVGVARNCGLCMPTKSHPYVSYCHPVLMQTERYFLHTWLIAESSTTVVFRCTL